MHLDLGLIQSIQSIYKCAAVMQGKRTQLHLDIKHNYAILVYFGIIGQHNFYIYSCLNS